MKTEHYRLIEHYGPDAIIEAFESFITEQRKERIDSVVSHRLDSIQLAIESPSDINNALAAVRTSEALGISAIHIINPENDAGSMRRLTQGANHWVNIYYHESLDNFLIELKKENRLLAGAIIGGPTTLSNVSIEKPICLLIGNEQRGLSEKARQACDTLYQIPMLGMSESLNLSVCAAISLYDTTQRKRQHLTKNNDLHPQQQKILKAAYYLNSVTQRLIDAALT
ncbi:MAG: RNA methyltransferase [Coxiellaceae bacterium]|nr:RNA methyltransferase [Coxiellaceae bacterium]